MMGQWWDGIGWPAAMWMSRGVASWPEVRCQVLVRIVSLMCARERPDEAIARDVKLTSRNRTQQTTAPDEAFTRGRARHPSAVVE